MLVKANSNYILGIQDPPGNSLLTHFKEGLGKLNVHKLNNNFNGTINPMRPLNDGREDAEYYPLPSHPVEEQKA